MDHNARDLDEHDDRDVKLIARERTNRKRTQAIPNAMAHYGNILSGVAGLR